MQLFLPKLGWLTNVDLAESGRLADDLAESGRLTDGRDASGRLAIGCQVSGGLADGELASFSLKLTVLLACRLLRKLGPSSPGGGGGTCTPLSPGSCAPSSLTSRAEYMCFVSMLDNTLRHPPFGF